MAARHARVASLTLLVTCNAIGAHAQQRPCADAAGSHHVDSATYRQCEVDRRPRIVGDVYAPAWPAALMAAGIAGSVEFRVPIDSSGRADTTRLEFIRANTPLFERAVRSAIAHWIYQPAMVGGRPVEAWTRGVIRFELPDSVFGMMSVPREVLQVRQRYDADSGDVLTVGAPERDPSAAPLTDRQATVARGMAGAWEIRRIISGHRAGEGPVICVRSVGGERLADLTPGAGEGQDGGSLATLGRAGCPWPGARTPGTARPSSAAVPDTVWMELGVVRAWRAGMQLVTVTEEAARGVVTILTCVTDVTPSAPIVACGTSQVWVKTTPVY